MERQGEKVDGDTHHFGDLGGEQHHENLGGEQHHDNLGGDQHLREGDVGDQQEGGSKQVGGLEGNRQTSKNKKMKFSRREPGKKMWQPFRAPWNVMKDLQ